MKKLEAVLNEALRRMEATGEPRAYRCPACGVWTSPKAGKPCPRCGRKQPKVARAAQPASEAGNGPVPAQADGGSAQTKE